MILGFPSSSNLSLKTHAAGLYRAAGYITILYYVAQVTDAFRTQSGLSTLCTVMDVSPAALILDLKA